AANPLSQSVTEDAGVRSPSQRVWKFGPLRLEFGEPVVLAGQERVGSKLVIRSAERTIRLGAEERSAARPPYVGEEFFHPSLVQMIGIEAEQDHGLFRKAKPTRCPSSFRSGICRAIILATSFSLWL